MPHSPSRPSLLSEAVQRLLDRHGIPDRPGIPDRESCTQVRVGAEHHGPGPARRGRRIGPRGGPSAYVLGCHHAGWTVDQVRPVSALFGWRAPPAAWAVVVVASGHARRLDGPDPAVSADGGPAPSAAVRIAVGAARTGETAARLSGDGVASDHPPDGGRLLDTLRRGLDLPTPAAPEGTARFLAVLWLASIAAASTGPSMGWPAAVGLHPAARLLAARGEHLSPRQLQGILAVAPSTWTWEVLRQAEIRSTPVVPLCSPVAAGWMDTGMYARWVLAQLPATVTLWPRVEDHLTPVARRRLKEWLAQNGVGLPGGTPHQGEPQ